VTLTFERTAAVAALERDYGVARVLPPGPERDALLRACGVPWHTLLVDIGDALTVASIDEHGAVTLHEVKDGQ